MKKKGTLQVLGIALMLLVVTVGSSCNRGLGCPGEFSVDIIEQTEDNQRCEVI